MYFWWLIAVNCCVWQFIAWQDELPSIIYRKGAVGQRATISQVFASSPYLHRIEAPVASDLLNEAPVISIPSTRFVI